MLEKTLETPLGSKEIKQANHKGNQPWTFIGRTAAETETPVLWPPDGESGLFGNDPDAGKDWRQKKKVTEDEMARWQLNEHEFEQIPGDSGDSRAWCAAFYRITKSQTQLSDWKTTTVKWL